jgi:uncharacterized membrane protein
MKSLSEAKMLGGIGSILLLVGAPIPQIGFVVSIVGLILQFIAIKNISEIVQDQSIFSNFLINFIFGILAIGSVLIVLIATIGSVGGISFFTALEGMNPTQPAEIFSYIQPLLSGCILALVVMWILLLIGAIYLRKSYNSIAEQTNVETFKTTGTLYLVGTASIIFIVGFLIIFIARIFEIISFFSIPDNPPKIEDETSLPS